MEKKENNFNPLDESISFEDALTRIEAIVARMESSDMNLEESLSCFQEGVELIKTCHSKLDLAEAKVEMIITSGDKLQLQKVELKDNGVQI